MLLLSTSSEFAGRRHLPLQPYALACHVHGLVERMKLPSVTLVGHDVGGQIVFAYLKAYPDALQKAVIMNVAVPSVDPWSEVMHNLYIWPGFDWYRAFPQDYVRLPVRTHRSQCSYALTFQIADFGIAN